MRAKTVNFERGQDPYKSMDIGLGEAGIEIAKALKDLQKIGINADKEISEDGLIELNIPGLDYYQVGYLSKEERDRGWDANDEWGWGIYNLEDGEMIIEGEPWYKVLDKILELIK